MELLLQAIEEKLVSVDVERKKWQQYKEEHINAERNLREFEKSYRKDILVPIGARALMPGTLYHTNEVFVAMYSGLFVKCSTDKALLVCQNRLKEADRRLELLDVEYKMYKDRLELPANEQVFGTDDAGQEIIEEYNEQEEQQWREDHKVRMRTEKAREAVERQRQQQHGKTDADIMQMLEQAELMEELESELEQLNVNDDSELVQHLLAAADATAANDMDTDEAETKQFHVMRAEAASLRSNTEKIEFYEKCLGELGGRLVSSMGGNELAECRITEGCLREAIAEIREDMDDSDEEPERPDGRDTSDDGDGVGGDGFDAGAMEKAVTVAAGVHQSAAEAVARPQTRADLEQIEREYERLDKGKSELLVFYKSQLRSVLKSITAHDQELYEFITGRIDQLRVDIHIEKQTKVEEDFVDDDDDVCRPAKCRSRTLRRTSNRLSDMDDYEDDGKRRIKFANEPVITTFHENDEPWRVQTECNQSFSDFIDEKFQFFTTPYLGADNESIFDNDNRDAGEAVADSNEGEPCNDKFTVNDNDKSVGHCAGGPKENGNIIIAPNEPSPSPIANGSVGTTPPTMAPPSPSSPPSLIIEFEHNADNCERFGPRGDGVIDSPLDIYEMFGGEPPGSGARDDGEPAHMAFLKKYMAAKEVKIAGYSRPFASTIDTNANAQEPQTADGAPDDSLTSVSIDSTIPNADCKPGKSILKNRDAVRTEVHQDPPPDSDDDIDEVYDDEDDDDEDDYYDDDDDDSEEPYYSKATRENAFPGFMQVVGDVMERNDPVEQVLERDENAASESIQSTSDSTGSQKRVSLFKMNRRR